MYNVPVCPVIEQGVLSQAEQYPDGTSYSAALPPRHSSVPCRQVCIDKHDMLGDWYNFSSVKCDHQCSQWSLCDPGHEEEQDLEQVLINSNSLTGHAIPYTHSRQVNFISFYYSVLTALLMFRKEKYCTG